MMYAGSTYQSAGNVKRKLCFLTWSIVIYKIMKRSGIKWLVLLYKDLEIRTL